MFKLQICSFSQNKGFNSTKRWPLKGNSQTTKWEKNHPWAIQKVIQQSYKPNPKGHSKPRWRKIEKARDEKEIWKVVNQVINPKEKSHWKLVEEECKKHFILKPISIVIICTTFSFFIFHLLFGIEKRFFPSFMYICEVLKPVLALVWLQVRLLKSRDRFNATEKRCFVSTQVHRNTCKLQILNLSKPTHSLIPTTWTRIIAILFPKRVHSHVPTELRQKWTFLSS